MDNRIQFTPTQTQHEFMKDNSFVRVILGPIGCLAGETRIITAQGPRRIDSLDRPTHVLSWDAKEGRFRFVLASAAYPKGRDALYRVQVPHGEWRAAGHHRVLCADGKYRQIQTLAQQGPSSVRICCADQTEKSAFSYQQSSQQDGPRWKRTVLGWMDRCGSLFRRYGPLPPQAEDFSLAFAPSQPGVLGHALDVSGAAHTHQGQPYDPLPTKRFALQGEGQQGDAGYVDYAQGPFSPEPQYTPTAPQSGFWTRLRQRWQQLVRRKDSYLHPNTYTLTDRAIIELTRESVQEVYWDLQVPNTNNYVTVDGVIHHNSGKSVTCVMEILRRILQQAPDQDGVRASRWVIMRNTVDQLRNTSLRTLLDWLPNGVWGSWKVTEKTFFLNHTLPDKTQIKAEIMAVAAETPDDVRKLLSLEITGAFLNEAREIAPEIIDGIMMRCRRYPSARSGGPTFSGVIMDTNPPEIGSWLQEKLENLPDNWALFKQPPAILSLEEYVAQEGEEPDPHTSTKCSQNLDWWINPNADNLDHLDPVYYKELIPGKTEAFVNVYLRNMFGQSLAGRAVYDKSFNTNFHVAKTPFIPLKSENHPVVIGIDLGRTPAAALLQRNAFNQIVMLDELVSENMGIETFLNKKLLPLLSQTQFAGCHFVVAPDPAGFFKQQIGEISPADIIRKAGFKVVRPGTNDPERRIEGVERVLLRHVDGKPAFVVNPNCREALRGFNGAYRYKLNKVGIQDEKPDKGPASHIHDAIQYGISIAEGGYSGESRATRREISTPRISSLAWT